MTTNIRIATDLWFEAGPGDDGPHHHIDLPSYLAEFFDRPTRDAEIVDIRLPNGTVVSRPLVACGVDGGEGPATWRLSLPTARQGGPSYAGRVIRLTRDQDGPKFVYRLDVADAESAATREWEMLARSTGNIGTLGGPSGRRYGYW